MTKANPIASCRHCQKPFLKPVKRAVFCSPHCALASKTWQGLADDCWPWQATRNNKGYGVLSYNGRFGYAHRLALETAKGGPIEPGMEARHKCDNPQCVNPAHLEEGTHSQNMKEAVERGRLRPVPPRNLGEAHGNSKLTVANVLEIRSSDKPIRVLAKQFGVGNEAILKVRQRRTWTHI